MGAPRVEQGRATPAVPGTARSAPANRAGAFRTPAGSNNFAH